MYQLNPPYCNYQKINKKRVYQVDRNLIEDKPKGFSIIFNDESKDHTYSDKGFKKVAINFVRIEASCNKCCTTFSLKLKLYNHLRSGCQEVTSPFFLLRLLLPSLSLSLRLYTSFLDLDLHLRARHTPPQLSLLPLSICH